MNFLFCLTAIWVLFQKFYHSKTFLESLDSGALVFLGGWIVFMMFAFGRFIELKVDEMEKAQKEGNDG